MWDWGEPPTFARSGQGNATFFFVRAGKVVAGHEYYDVPARRRRTGRQGVWMSVWADNVDEVHKLCVAAGLEVTFPPTNMPWNVREMHLRHPDGHVFRVSRRNEDEQ